MIVARYGRSIAIGLLAVIGSIFGAQAAPLPASPKPHYIRDDAKWLSPAAFSALDSKLEKFERDTSSQFVVAIFPKIPDGEEMFDFSQKLYESWKPGSKEKDNGAIFLIFAADRKMRIQTGQGMEGVLPDARCKRIIEDVVAPQLRQGNREAAINAGVDAMIAAAEGEYTGTGRTLNERQPGFDAGNMFVLIIVILILLRVFAAGPLAAFDIIFSVLGASRSSGGWSGGSSSGGWSGGGGGGGFSGGGGSSGGGGASGGW